MHTLTLMNRSLTFGDKSRFPTHKAMAGSDQDKSVPPKDEETSKKQPPKPQPDQDDDRWEDSSYSSTPDWGHGCKANREAAPTGLSRLA